MRFIDGIVVDSDDLLSLDTVPGSLVVVGAGVIGIEYASMFAALGSRVTVVERRDHILDFCDREIVEAELVRLLDQARDLVLVSVDATDIESATPYD